jgi:epoxyqueuosine reductase
MANPNDTAAEMLSRLKRHHLRGKVVPLARLYEMRDEVHSRHQKGEFNEDFYRIELSGMEFEIPNAVPEAASLIIVASPQPTVRISFTVNGRSFPVLVPPTYSYATDGLVRSILEDVLHPRGYLMARAFLPLKLLAVRGGLAEYGRNNITYVPGMGSFHRLAAFFTDLPCSEDIWREPTMMKLCRSCTACAESCPTNAIASDRFLLHAERCITFMNEFPGEFPAWLDPAWHNCIVGCLHCQRCCPADARVIDWIEDQDSFSQEETDLVMRGASKGDLPQVTTEKLERLGLLDYLEILPRNMKVVLK